MIASSVLRNTIISGRGARAAGLVAVLLLVVPCAGISPGLAGAAAGQEKPAAEAPAEEVKELVRGKVVALKPLLEERLDTKLDDEMAELYALVTEDGRLFPILREGRGRAFYQDDRLRDVPVELYLRHLRGDRFSQVLLVYRLREGKRFAVDYWCDICSISMYWIKQCECCQGPTRLRETPVDRLPATVESHQRSGE